MPIIEPLDLVDQIDLTDVSDCIRDLINQSINHSDTKNKMDQIMQKLAGYDPTFNWRLKEASLGGNTNAVTSTRYDFSDGSISSTFNKDKYSRSSNISLLRTILHEAIHAYVATVAYNSGTVEEREKLLGQDWANAFINHGHDYMITSYIEPLAEVLEKYGNENGIQEKYPGFFRDLAFGGLTHLENGSEMDIFKQMVPSATDRRRIVNTITIESEGKDLNGYAQNQTGDKLGC